MPALPLTLRGVRRLVTLGDSITEAGGFPGGYVWLIQETLRALHPDQPIEIINAGISGHKSTDMAARFQRDVLDRQPDLVTVSVGINDVWHGFTPEHPNGGGPNGVDLTVSRARVTEMVTSAQAARVRVALLSTTIIDEDPASPQNQALAGYNAALQEIARERGSAFIDQNTPFHRAIAAHRHVSNDSGLWLTTDGVHMNAHGNWLMARVILQGLGVTCRAQDSVAALVRASGAPAVLR